MKDILLVIFLGCLIITAFLWMWDRRRWKRKEEEQAERQREYLEQKEKADAHIRRLEQELDQAKREKHAIMLKVQGGEEQQAQRDRECLDRSDAARRAAMKIHLYSQLLKEQCQTEAAEKQCGIILRECEALLHDQSKPLSVYGDNEGEQQEI